MCARFRRDFLHKNVDKNVNYVIYVCMTFGLNVSIFYAVDTNKHTNKQTRAAKIVLTADFSSNRYGTCKMKESVIHSVLRYLDLMIIRLFIRYTKICMN